MTAGEALAAMRGFAVAGLEEILGGRSPLVLAPHPDDESLGCGGLLAASVAAGLAPFVLVITDGAASHPGSRAYPPARLAAIRREEATAAVARLGLGVDRIDFLGLPDAAAPQDGPDLATAVEAVVAVARRAGSGVVLSSWRHDPHCDHLATHRIGERAAAAAGLGHLAYPVWGWTLPAGAALDGEALDGGALDGGAPRGWRLDVTPWLGAKRAAVAAHRSQSGGVVTDDAAGFALPAALLDAMLGRYETYVVNP